MSRDQNHMNNVSLKLSEVLSDIDVNERMVLKRRRMIMLCERMRTIGNTLATNQNVVTYFLGSQSEGTTTLGLGSDIDQLTCDLNVNVIGDWSKWRPGVLNLHMIQDETTSPGYCLLQQLSLSGQYPFRQTEKVLCKHSFFRIPESAHLDLTTHGPAQSPNTPPGFADRDIVPAFHCDAWPVEAQPWLDREGIGGWPTEEMKRCSMNTGCFLVPVSSKSGQNKDTEWRISTSLAERILVYCMNITQIRCYVLMKMILKTFINPHCNDVISSYMCKTVLFHCIQNTPSHQWQENNLLPCLTDCLLKLQHFITEENCPHFIVLENNLMAGKISDPVKHQLLEILQNIIQNEGRILLEISIDDLGARLHGKMNNIPMTFDVIPSLESATISYDLLICTAHELSLLCMVLLHAACSSNDSAQVRLLDFISSLVKVYLNPDVSCTRTLEKSICELLFPLLCSPLGSMIASSDIHMNNTISPQALAWFSAGLISDVASGRLKYASALYCTGDIEGTEIVLRNIEDQYDECTVVSKCTCYPSYRYRCFKPRLFMKCNTGNEELIKQHIAFCVRFMACEKDCVPKELQYEMFRPKEDDRMNENLVLRHMFKSSDETMVDSLPYLYFLQYKTYGRLQRPAGQQCALTYLATTIDTESDLGHRETALNLLGQCMEQENRYNDALRCYVRSLNVRPRNNAAKIHICRLLSSLVNRPVPEQ